MVVVKHLEIRECATCGGNFHVDPDTGEREAIYMGPNPCTCQAAPEDANQAAARTVREATDGK